MVFLNQFITMGPTLYMYMTITNGVYKPTNITIGPHIVDNNDLGRSWDDISGENRNLGDS